MKMEKLGDAYLFRLPEAQLEIELANLTESRDAINAELTLALDGNLLHHSRHNLQSVTTRNQLIKALTEKVQSLDWSETLEQVFYMAIQSYRTGEPTIDLRQYTPEGKPRWLCFPYVEHGGPTILFGDGGVGKSLLALAICYTVASGDNLLGTLWGKAVPVLYLDWETGPETHWRRLKAICDSRFAEVPPIHYRRMVTSLPEAAGTIRREVDRLHAGLVALDSLGPAGAGIGEPEASGTALTVFNAMRSFNVPCLGTHHVSHAGMSTNRGKPFGSVYYSNLARLTWEIETVRQEGEDEITVAFVNRKVNYGKLLKRHALRIAFHNNDTEELEGIHFETVAIKDVPELEDKVPLGQRILSRLREGPWTQHDLAEELGVTENQIRARTSELKRKGMILRLPDSRWGAVEHREERA